MEREKIDEILYFLNNGQVLNNIKAHENKIRSLISEVEETFKEESSKVEDEDYFYGKLNSELYKFIGSDSKKIELLDEIEDDYDKTDIIASMQSDDKKIEALDKVKDTYYKQQIIEYYLKSDDKKIEVLDRIKDNQKKVEIIVKFKSDDNKIKALDKLEGEDYKLIIIKKYLKSDDKKIEALDKLKSENNKVGIVKFYLQSDDKKIEALDKLENEDEKLAIITHYLKSDDKKIEALDKLKYDEDKVSVINSLSRKSIINLSEEKRIKILNISYDDYTNTIIIESMSEEKRIECLNSINNDFTKIIVIKSLPEEKRMEYLDSLNDDYAKAIVIKSLPEEKRIEYLDSLNDDFAKTVIITGLSDEKRIEYLDSLNDDYCKATVLRTLQNTNKKINFPIPIGLDKNMTFGIEIESEGKEKLEIFEIINNFKTSGIIKGDWNIKHDGSLVSGSEVVSPILTDNTENIIDIYTTCLALQTSEQKTSERCGGHVHIGADYLKSVEEYKELLEIWGNAEKVYFLISNRAGELPRNRIEEYSSPISGKIEDSNLFESKDDEFIEDAKEIQKNRYSAINFMNLEDGEKNTIEFRLSNGTIDPKVWIENIRLYGRTVQVAHEIVQIKMKLREGKKITEEEKRKLQMKAILKKDVDLDEKKDALLELLFDEEERKVYEERYQVNKALEEKEHRLEGMKFGRVDFEENYETVADKLPKTIQELNTPEPEQKTVQKLDDEGR